MAAYPERICVLLLRNADWWVAQCLEVDIAVQAKSWTDALRSLEITINRRIEVCDKEGVDPFDLPKAPDEYWDLFRTSPPIQLVDDTGNETFLPGFLNALKKREVHLSRDG